MGDLSVGFDKSILKYIAPTSGVYGVTVISILFPAFSPEKINFSNSDSS